MCGGSCTRATVHNGVLSLSSESGMLVRPWHLAQMQQYNLGEDCPIFDGLFDFCRLYTGGSIDGAVRLNHGLSVGGRGS